MSDKGWVKNRTSKVGMRLTILLGGVFTVCLYKFMGGRFPGEDLEPESIGVGNSYEAYSDLFHRHLDMSGDNCTVSDGQPDICIGYGADACKRLGDDQMYGILFIVLALLYLFVGIAIVCDELFVPALEIVAEDLQLSNDVAGATLMAAGGSAPELATSFVGVFKRSDVGFGTIVGSAVFNVLFVISMCVMFTPKKYSPLELTWWPLFRDCSYYTITLATLAAFMYDGNIYWYEALIQLSLYFGYVYMMSWSERIENYITVNYINVNKDSSVTPDESADFNELDDKAEDGKAGAKIPPSPSKDLEDSKESGDASFVRPSTFRVGILQLLTQKHSIIETAGIAFVSKIKGDVNAVFLKLDSNGNGQLEPHELKDMLEELGTPPEELTEEKIAACMKEMDPGDLGYVTKPAFTLWYTGNEQRLKNQTRQIFDKYDFDNKNTISRDDVTAFMLEMGHGMKGESDMIKEAALSIPSTNKADDKYLTFEDFSNWYESSLFWEQDKNAAEEAAAAQESMWEGLLSGFGELTEADTPLSSKINFVVTVPLTLLFCLIPDCRPPGQEGKAVFTLLASIVMIAFFAIIMVELAEIFGASLGIPDVVMGLTILAAGTSVPDLLSSVIVAQQGQGDMAVSSSIGSNIFDVAFGLPLPWLIFNIVAAVSGCNCPVQVGADGLFISLLILLFMVGAIVLIIHLSHWKMTHQLGYAMFLLYFVYVGVSLGITPASDYVVDSCSPFAPF